MERFCSKCSVKGFPRAKIPEELSPRDILVIGDMVTPVECARGKLMQGPAVDVLKQTLKKLGFPYSEEEVHYTVAMACALPRKKGQPIPKEKLMLCRERLLAEIKQVNPKLIITLGKAAFQTLEGNFNSKINDELGRLREYSFIPGKVMPVVHPSVIMRAPNEYKGFYLALSTAFNDYQGKETRVPVEVKYTVLQTEADVEKALEFLKKFKIVSADIETTSLDYREAEFLVMGICYGEDQTIIIPRHLRQHIKKFFSLDNLKWIWQHGKYDAKVCWRRGIGKVPLDEDTIYMHYVLDETSAHDLGTLSKQYLSAKEYKYKMNQNWKAVTLDSYDSFFEALCERVATDCSHTYQLWAVFKRMLDAPKNLSLKKVYSDILMPFARHLIEMEQNGLLVDQDYLEQMGKSYAVRIENLKKEIEKEAEQFWNPLEYMETSGAKTAPQKFNPGSPKQVAWMVFDKLKLKPKKRKAKSTGKDVLKSIETDIKLIDLILNYRNVLKEYSTYVIGTLAKRDIDGRVRSTFSLHITATGRTSSKEPNVQNVSGANSVGNIRRAYIPREGHILMEIDYSGAELRWLAFLSGCPILKKVFSEGRNLHVETATALFGEEFTPAQKLRAKAVNFGIPYGRQAKSFKDEFGITMHEAHDMINGWLDNYYGARDYLNWCAEQVTDGKYLQSPWGRRRRFGLVTSDSIDALQNEAKNFPIQSSSSDLTLMSSVLGADIIRPLGARVVNFIHDSILVEIPAQLETVLEVARSLNNLMVELPIKLFGCDVPFKTDVEIGSSWGELVELDISSGKVIVGKDEIEIPFEEWWKEESLKKHAEVYSHEWYKNLKPL